MLSGGGVPESKRANELSEHIGVKIMPSQVLLWDLFLYDLPFEIWLFSLPVTIVWLWNLLHSCLFFLVQVLQGHSPFKSLSKRYTLYILSLSYFIHKSLILKDDISSASNVVWIIFSLAVDLLFSFTLNLAITILC